MFDREKHGLRGPVKSCTEESAHPAMTDADGKTYPEVRSEYSREYDPDGRMLIFRSRNSDGSLWLTRYSYDAFGRLLKTASGVEGQAFTETSYSFDKDDRLQNISNDKKPHNPVIFHYDEHGRKTKIETSRAADYRPNTATCGSPFEVADRAPNFPCGGSAVTSYDEDDRATEVQVRDANGDLVNRASRTYDAQGRVIEEMQILDNLETIIPMEARAKMLDESGLSADQLRQELRAQLTKLMAGQSGPYLVSYRYDTLGRVNHTSRRIFNHGDEIETTYNEHGDIQSEVTRSTPLAVEPDLTAPGPSLPSYSEVRYSYQYDQHGNWVEKGISYRSSPDGTFESSTRINRTLAYY